MPLSSRAHANSYLSRPGSQAAMEQSVRSFSPSFVHPVGIRRHLPLFIFLPGLDGSVRSADCEALQTI